MRRSQWLAILGGIAVLTFYLLSTSGVVSDVNVLTTALAFAIGPVAAVAIRRLIDDIDSGRAREACRIARFYLLTAFVIFTVMVVVQQTTVQSFRPLIAAAAPARVEVLRAVYAGVDVVQLGLDVAFDVFYTLGLIAFGAALYRHPDFGRVTGMLGVGSAALLLALNLFAFPQVPTQVGLIDAGPITGVWWLIVIAQQIRRKRRPAPVIAA